MQPACVLRAVCPSGKRQLMTAAELVPDAADELSKLTQYYYNVVYVPGRVRADGKCAPVDAAAWLVS